MIQHISRCVTINRQVLRLATMVLLGNKKKDASTSSTGLSLLLQLKPSWNTSFDFMVGFSHDSFPITISACNAETSTSTAIL